MEIPTDLDPAFGLDPIPFDVANPAGDFAYMGFTTGPGVPTSAARWAVRRVEDVGSGGTRHKITWAGGNQSPVHVMDDFAVLNYS
jgi:hypothetical protein